MKLFALLFGVMTGACYGAEMQNDRFIIIHNYVQGPIEVRLLFAQGKLRKQTMPLKIPAATGDQPVVVKCSLETALDKSNTTNRLRSQNFQLAGLLVNRDISQYWLCDDTPDQECVINGNPRTLLYGQKFEIHEKRWGEKGSFGDN